MKWPSAVFILCICLGDLRDHCGFKWDVISFLSRATLLLSSINDSVHYLTSVLFWCFCCLFVFLTVSLVLSKVFKSVLFLCFRLDRWESEGLPLAAPADSGWLCVGECECRDVGQMAEEEDQQQACRYTPLPHTYTDKKRTESAASLWITKTKCLDLRIAVFVSLGNNSAFAGSVYYPGH